MIHDLTGQMIGHYQIIRPIEQGGMATVYLARDINLQRQVAIKVFQFEQDQKDTREFFYRFTREAQVVARLDHPNIVLVHDYGEQDSLAYLVMPYFSNGSLKQLLNKRGRLPIPEALHFIIQLLNALQYAHNRGLIHRDIKPGNILFKNDQTPVLADFGLVKENVTDNTGDITAIGLSGKRQHPLTDGAIMGTPYYMAPEQIRGHVQRQSDIYSIGLVLYEMLTGRLPYVGDEKDGLLNILLKQANDPPLPITELDPDIPSQLGEVIMHALEKDVDRRYQRPTDFSEALRLAAPPHSGSFPEIEESGYLNALGYKSDPGPNDTSPLPTIELQQILSEPQPTPSSVENPPIRPSDTVLDAISPISPPTHPTPRKRRLSYLLYGVLAAILLVTLGFTSPLLLAFVSHPNPTATQPAQSTIASTTTQPTRSATALVVTQPTRPATVPATQISCPPTNEARAAVMTPAPYSSQAHNVVIYANSYYDTANHQHGSLMSYDTVTGKTHTIVTVPHQLSNAQLSADGQWVIFSTSGADATTSLIQMVRIDGAELQTLYCSSSSIANLSISPGLSSGQGWSLFLSENLTDQSSDMIVLDIPTGEVQLHSASINHSYRPIEWINDQSLYVLEDHGIIAYDPRAQSRLAVLTIRDVKTDPNPDLSYGMDIDMPTFCSDMDFSTDFRTIFTSHCTGQGGSGSGSGMFAASQGPSEVKDIKLEDVDTQTWSKPTTLATSNTQAITELRAVTSTCILFVVRNEDQYNNLNGLWKINTDGTGEQRISTETKNLTYLNRYSQYPWSNVSRDGYSYAFRIASPQATGYDKLFVGSLSGGQPKVIAAVGVDGVDRSAELEVVGWTTL